jgi:hypothetical protein
MRRILAILVLCAIVGSACSEPVAPELEEVRAGQGTLSLGYSGAVSGRDSVAGSLSIRREASDALGDGSLNGEGAFCESVFLDADTTHPGVRVHYVVAHFQIIPPTGDRILLSLLFGVLDSGRLDPFVTRGAVGMYETKLEETWRYESLPYRWAQVELVAAAGVLRSGTLQLGRGHAQEGSPGHRFTAAPGDARIEIESFDAAHMHTIRGFVSGTLTDAAGGTVVLERSPFEIVAPMVNVRRF